MSNTVLKKLNIEHLRGSVVPFSLPFEKGKKLTVIYGENGTGKSTICDAFEFLGKGKVSSLENRGLGRTQRYWHSLNKNPSDVSVTLETNEATCRATIIRNNVIAAPPEARPDVEVLRRSQILSLIQATPGDRYEAIKRFIDVSAVETSENALKKSIDDLKQGRQIALARLQENKETVRQFWEAAGKPIKNPMEWAEKESNREPETFDEEINKISDLQTAYSNLLDYPERILSERESLTAANKMLSEAIEDEKKNLDLVSKDASETLMVLQAAQTYLIKNPTPAICPLCESSEKVNDLSNRITDRLSVFSSLQTAQQKVKTCRLTVSQADQQVQSTNKAAKQHISNFAKCVDENTWPEDIKLPKSPTPEDPSSLDSWLESIAELHKEWEKAKSARYDKKQFITTLKSALTTWNENLNAQKEIDRLLPNLTRALEILTEERRKFTDKILSNIANEVGRLYEAVHPGEGLEKISLDLDPDRRASLEMGASFCGQYCPPQAYFSDSHLDTLGLCVFLALSSMEQPENTILILDDVLASIDEPHVDRLIEMLYGETIKFKHCIITTHYRPWKHKLRWGWLKTGQCQFVELAEWTNLNGLTIIRTVPDIERLELLLAESEPDPQLVCAKAGYILEAALNFLTLLYECAVPRKPEDRYILGDLLPAISKKLRDALSVDVQSGLDEKGNPVYNNVSLKPILDEINRISEARNVFGCHFKSISFELLDSDAINFGQQVLNLMKILTDPEAGWPKNDKTGKYWATSGETRRLYPLRKPS